MNFVQDLREVCLTYMTEHIVTAASHGQLVSWLQYASWSAHPSFSEVRSLLPHFHSHTPHVLIYL